jgi:hypothetical protein
MVLNQQPERIQDFYDLAQGRTACRTLARLLVMKARRDQREVDYDELPKIEFQLLHTQSAQDGVLLSPPHVYALHNPAAPLSLLLASHGDPPLDSCFR